MREKRTFTPDRVTRLVLVAPDGFASAGFEYGKAFEVPGYMHAIRQILPRAMVRMSMKPAYFNPEMLTDALVDRYYDLLRAPGARQALLERLRQTIPADPVPLLATIGAPTLLLWGSQDAMIPAANANDYLAALTAVTEPVKSVQFDKTGHVPQEEAAAESAKAVEGFLAR
jgi:pimeloyl-ACP methyl ester carboxylesterase